MDLDTLLRIAGQVGEYERFGYYKRVAEVCLFITGVFTDHTLPGHFYGNYKHKRQSLTNMRLHRSLEEYEFEGRRFCRLAANHPTSSLFHLSEVFSQMRQHFLMARKPLIYLSSQYLHSSKGHLFGKVVV